MHEFVGINDKRVNGNIRFESVYSVKINVKTIMNWLKPNVNMTKYYRSLTNEKYVQFLNKKRPLQYAITKLSIKSKEHDSPKRRWSNTIWVWQAFSGIRARI